MYHIFYERKCKPKSIGFLPITYVLDCLFGQGPMSDICITYRKIPVLVDTLFR